MNYIQVKASFEPLDSPLFWIAVGAIAVAAIALLIRAFTDRDNAPIHIMSVAVVLFIGIISLLGFGQVESQQKVDARNSQLEQVQTQIKERYNVELTDKQVKNLSYPKSKPSESFDTFGSFVESTPKESGNGFVQRKVVLAWQNGKMILGQSTDGETFKQLQQAG